MKVQLSLFLLISFSGVLGMESTASKGSSKQLAVSWATIQFQNKKYREEQQDTFSYSPTTNGGHLFGVYDGHGGKEVSEFLQNAFPVWFASVDVATEVKLRGMFMVAEQHVLGKKGWDNCGSTATMVHIDSEQKKIFFSNTGDSRAALERKGKICFETKDHKPYQFDEIARIQKLGGIVSVEGYVYNNELMAENLGLGMTRSIGDKDCKVDQSGTLKRVIIPDPEISSFALTPENRFIVLASDGLWDDFTSGEVIEKITSWYSASDKSHKELSEKLVDSEWLANDHVEEVKFGKNSYLNLFAKQLCRESLERGSEDNITITIVQLDWNDEKQ